MTINEAQVHHQVGRMLSDLETQYEESQEVTKHLGELSGHLNQSIINLDERMKKSERATEEGVSLGARGTGNR